MKTVVIGNSHVGALKRGADRMALSSDTLVIAPFGDGVLELSPFSRVVEGRVEFTVAMSAKVLRDLTGLDHLDPGCAWGVCMGTHNVRIYRNRIWRKAAPSEMADAGVRPFSRAVMAAIFDEDLRHVKAFLLQLKASGARVFVVSAPPPRRDGGAAKHGVPLNHIAAIDRMARDHFQAWLAAHDIAFVAPPAESADEDGFLKAEFAQLVNKRGEPDPHHANTDYGERMVRKILADMRLP